MNIRKTRTFILLIAFCLLLVICSACGDNDASSSPPVKQTATVQTDTTTISTSTLTSNASSITTTSTTTFVTAQQVTKATIPTTTTIAKRCTHTKWGEDENGVWNGRGGFPNGWEDVKPGIEHRYTLESTGCTKRQEVVYKCPVCLEPVVCETLEPIGHDFSGEEELIIYPSIDCEGSYGIKCQRESCQEYTLTTPISKRGGSYSTVNSDFEVKVSTKFQLQSYKHRELSIYIYDRRFWGDVPTITYDKQTNRLVISFLGKNSQNVQWSFNIIYIDKIQKESNTSFIVNIQDNGTFESHYSTWGFDGNSD